MTRPRVGHSKLRMCGFYGCHHYRTDRTEQLLRQDGHPPIARGRESRGSPNRQQERHVGLR